MKNWLMRITIVLLSFAPGACHYFVTTPLLWKQTSSSAFDALVGLWIMDIIIIMLAVIFTSDWTKKQKGS